MNSFWSQMIGSTPSLGKSVESFEIRQSIIYRLSPDARIIEEWALLDGFLYYWSSFGGKGRKEWHESIILSTALCIPIWMRDSQEPRKFWLSWATSTHRWLQCLSSCRLLVWWYINTKRPLCSSVGAEMSWESETSSLVREHLSCLRWHWCLYLVCLGSKERLKFLRDRVDGGCKWFHHQLGLRKFIVIALSSGFMKDLYWQ